MTLKEELEILRGETIKVFDGNPMDIPYIETSDTEKLCKHPVVSVHMLTYNHEPYIRQAIEGVMMQKTDFEFELVIGEDASTDKTREICFEYQKKYPDKIRVLWWHENVSKFGGNARRVLVHCRGEFIAFCEGDDYWLDPLKLQKQVNVMRKYPSVGYCFTGAQVVVDMPHDHPRLKNFVIKKWESENMFNFDHGPYEPGLVPRDEFWCNRWIYPRTSTVMFRTEHYNLLTNKLEIFNWQLRIGDVLYWNAFPFVSDAYFLPDITGVYRLHAGGLTLSRMNPVLYFELDIVNLFFAIKHGEPHSVINRLVLQILDKRFFARINNTEKINLRELYSLTLVKCAIRSGDRFWKIYSILSWLGVNVPPDKLRHLIQVIKHPLKYLKSKSNGVNL